MLGLGAVRIACIRLCVRACVRACVRMALPFNVALLSLKAIEEALSVGIVAALSPK